ncbi:hypothetical protein NL676_009829 [Syzygium grande]|nr:hypothetical protein NL676_009829 [Syzygium grande]
MPRPRAMIMLERRTRSSGAISSAIGTSIGMPWVARRWRISRLDGEGATWRPHVVAELLEADVGISLLEQNPLAGTVHRKLTVWPLPDPPGQRVITVHKRLGEHFLDDSRRIFSAFHRRVVRVEEKEGSRKRSPSWSSMSESGLSSHAESLPLGRSAWAHGGSRSVVPEKEKMVVVKPFL